MLVRCRPGIVSGVGDSRQAAQPEALQGEDCDEEDDRSTRGEGCKNCRAVASHARIYARRVGLSEYNATNIEYYSHVRVLSSI